MDLVKIEGGITLPGVTGIDLDELGGFSRGSLQLCSCGNDFGMVVGIGCDVGIIMIFGQLRIRGEAVINCVHGDLRGIKIHNGQESQNMVSMGMG